MKVVIFGATGMVGRGALLECLDDPRVESVLVVTRHSVGVSHPKLREIIHQDFFDFGGLQPEFTGLDACFFCLGVSSVGMSERNYHRLTFELTLAAATTLANAADGRLTFCYVSGEGTDSTEGGRTMWARIKGKTENAILQLPFRAAYMFRPGYIQPLRGIKSKTRWYQAVRRDRRALSGVAAAAAALRHDDDEYGTRDDRGRRARLFETYFAFGRHQPAGCSLVEDDIAGFSVPIICRRDARAAPACARQSGRGSTRSSARTAARRPAACRCA